MNFACEHKALIEQFALQNRVTCPWLMQKGINTYLLKDAEQYTDIDRKVLYSFKLEPSQGNLKQKILDINARDKRICLYYREDVAKCMHYANAF